MVDHGNETEAKGYREGSVHKVYITKEGVYVMKTWRYVRNNHSVHAFL